jgi:hypothetical protein
VKRLQSNHIESLSGLAKELVVTAETKSMFQDWPENVRHSVVVQLESAFLDPNNTLKQASGRSLPSWSQLRTAGGLEAFRQSLGQAVDTNVEASQAFAELSHKVSRFDGVSAVDWTINTNLFPKSPALAVNAVADRYEGYRIDLDDPTPSQHLGYRDYLIRQ